MKTRLHLSLIGLWLAGCEFEQVILRSGEKDQASETRDASQERPQGDLDARTQQTDAAVVASQDANANADVAEPIFESCLGNALVACLKFEESSGRIAFDESGFDNHGRVLYGTSPAAALDPAPNRVAGIKGRSLSFDGKQSWLAIPVSESINSLGTTGRLTAMAWVRPGSTANGVIASRQEAGTANAHFELALESGRPRATVHFFHTASGTPIVPANEWSHVALTYDGITLKLLVNGQPISSTSIGWPIAADSTFVSLGARNSLDTMTDFFVGEIDGFRLFSRALSDVEVSELAK